MITHSLLNQYITLLTLRGTFVQKSPKPPQNYVMLQVDVGMTVTDITHRTKVKIHTGFIDGVVTK